MQENSRHAVGIDIGTTTVRCVVGHIDNLTGVPTIVGVGTAPNNGMRKGVIVNLNGPMQAIDDALGVAERMSGFQVDAATISINGSHILSTHTDGMIAVGGLNHEINEEDVARIEDVATIGKVPANREILEVVPHSYILDGQDSIKNPIGMTGTRLEINAHVVSILAPYLSNLQKTAENAHVVPKSVVVSGVAAAKAVLSEQQIENGVMLLDIGGSTTNIAIYDEGDLQYAAVIPIGGVNITNDLAIGLKTDPEIAERIKLEYGSAIIRNEESIVNIESKGETHEFSTADIDEIIEARLEDIFESILKEVKKAGRNGKLPSGAVLTGGSANLSGIVDYAKKALGLAVRIGKPTGYGGVADDIDKPQFATALGLMLIDVGTSGVNKKDGSSKGKKALASGTGFLSKMMSRFRA